MYRIPIALIYARFFIGFIILILSLLPPDNYKTIVIILLTIGLLTDILN